MTKIYLMVSPTLKQVLSLISTPYIKKLYTCIGKKGFSEKELRKIIPICNHENDIDILLQILGNDIEIMQHKDAYFKPGDTLYVVLHDEEKTLDLDNLEDITWKIEFMC